MKTSSLWFLFLWAGLAVVAENSGDEACKLDIDTVLRELTELTAEQKVELRYANEQIKALDARLRASEKAVEQLRETKKQVEQLASDNKGKGHLIVLHIFFIGCVHIHRI